ncbi:MAG: hypothetical protein ACE5QW_08710, partial [Thermoplasmata archaeon]
GNAISWNNGPGIATDSAYDNTIHSNTLIGNKEPEEFVLDQVILWIIVAVAIAAILAAVFVLVRIRGKDRA